VGWMARTGATASTADIAASDRGLAEAPQAESERARAMSVRTPIPVPPEAT
jgi:hypothetical protein